MTIQMTNSCHFLIIDDYTSMRSLLKSNLKELGFQKISEAEDGNKAYTVLMDKQENNEAVDFIICDVVMPECDGIQFLKRVRGNELFQKIPILMLTSESDRKTVISTISAGATNYLLKPWNLDVLGEKIAFCWSKAHADD